MGDNTEWVLVDVTTNRTQHPADLQRELLSLLEEEWGIVRAEDGYLLLEHGETNKTLPETFFTFAYPTDTPQVPYDAQFGEQIELLGYDIKQDFWGRVLVQWHLRPLMPLPPTLSIDTALLNADGTPLPDTTNQPLTLLYWLPLSEWEVGKDYLLTTLPREAAEQFYPGLTVRDEGQPLAKKTLAASKEPLRFTEWGEWLVAGEWRLEDNHAQRGEVGWREWEAPASLAASDETGEWEVARLGAWEVAREEQAEALHLTLHWQAKESGATPTQRFIHLVPKEGVPIPITQLDGPLGGEYPVTQWLKDEWISEEVMLILPPEGPSEWRILVGLYDPVSQERLPVKPDGGSHTFELR